MVRSSMFDLSERVAIVTGAGAGLGRAIAKGLAFFGADIVGCVYRNHVALAETCTAVENMGRRALAVSCDVAAAGDVAHMFAEVDRVFGRVDLLVNNAAQISHCRPEDLRLDEWRRVLDVNVTGCFLCAQAAGRRMIKQGWGGSIINISSISGSTAMGRGNVAYSVSKAALNHMTRELAIEWAKHNIRVNAILPCHFMTPALRAVIDDPQFDAAALVDRFVDGIPMGRLGELEDIVGPVVFLASDASKMVTGVTLPVDGGNLALNAAGDSNW